MTYFCQKPCTKMIQYQSSNQLSIEEFQTPFEMNMVKNNRWVIMAQHIPWDELASVYHKSLDADQGRPALDARVAIGAIIIKHKLNLSDEEAVEQIKENPYMQYFLGNKAYDAEQPFASSLFVLLRSRMGVESFESFSNSIIAKSEQKKKRDNQPPASQENVMPKGDRVGQEQEEENKDYDTGERKGKLLTDATICDQYIKYPTDIDLLNKAREHSEELIDFLYKKSGDKKKVRTYRKTARKLYLSVAKKKNKKAKEIRKAIGAQLRFLSRNIQNIHQYLDKFEGSKFPLQHKEQRLFWIIQTLYDQQFEMYKNKTHSVGNRIVSVHQPHVRPMVRGKAKNKVEFGAKINVGQCNGYAQITKLGWDAYNENTDLKNQVKKYKKTFGHYPEVVIADGIYGTRENRNYLKSLNIRFSGKHLGRKPIETNDNKEQLRKQAKQFKHEQGQRNKIEGKFGEAKNGHTLNKVRARLQATSESWIGAVFFVMNLKVFIKEMEHFLRFILKKPFFKNYSPYRMEA